jgi:hypothetical protein
MSPDLSSRKEEWPKEEDEENDCADGPGRHMAQQAHGVRAGAKAENNNSERTAGTDDDM